MRLLIVSLFVVDLVLGAISEVEVPSTPGPLPASKVGKKSRQWPCSGGCGMGYYGLSGTGLGGYSPYYGGLGGMGINPLLTGGLGGAGGCMDLSPQCATYAATGQCAANPFLIRRLCPLSCGTGCMNQYGLGGLGGYGGMGGLGTGIGMGGYNPMLGGGMYPGVGYGSGLYGGGLGGIGTGIGGLGTGLYGNNMLGNGLYGGLGGVGLGRSIYETGIYRKPNGDVPVTSIKSISDSVRANTPVAALPALPKRFY